MQPTLYQFFRHQVRKRLGGCGLAEPAMVDYVSQLLARFADIDALYAVRDREGRRLEHLVDLFAQCHGNGERSGDWRRHAAVTHHIGEYTLFMSAVFRDRLKARGQLHYYCASGQQAYRQCACYEPNPQRQRLFRGLHLRFARIAEALHEVARREPPPAFIAEPRRALLASLWRV